MLDGEAPLTGDGVDPRAMNRTKKQYLDVPNGDEQNSDISRHVVG